MDTKNAIATAAALALTVAGGATALGLTLSAASSEPATQAIPTVEVVDLSGGGVGTETGQLASTSVSHEPGSARPEVVVDRSYLWGHGRRKRVLAR